LANLKLAFAVFKRIHFHEVEPEKFASLILCTMVLKIFSETVLKCISALANCRSDSCRLNRSDESSKIFVEFNKADILEGKTQLFAWNIVIFQNVQFLPERTNQFLLVSV